MSHRSAADEPGGRVAALRVPKGGELTRKEIDDYSAFVSIYGAKGLAYIKVNDRDKPNEKGLQSPIVKFLPVDVLTALRKAHALQGAHFKVLGSAAGAKKVARRLHGAQVCNVAVQSRRRARVVALLRDICAG